MAQIKVNQKKIEKYYEGSTGFSYKEMPHGTTDSTEYEQSHWGYQSNGGARETNNTTLEDLTYSNGVMNVETTYLPYSLDNVTNESQIDSTLEELVNSGDYITPMDYYSKVSSNSSTETDEDDEISNLLKSVSNEPKYFWVESFKNWCYFGKYDNTENTENDICWYLYMWNGRNGWDRVEDVVISPTKYLYKKKDLLGVADVNGEEVYPKLFRICNVDSGRGGYGYYLDDYGVNSMVNFGLLLDKDIKYSVYDGKTFKVNRLYKDNFHIEMKYGVNYSWLRYCNGCPMIYRTASGELAISFVLAVGGTHDLPYDTYDYHIYGSEHEPNPSVYDSVTLHSKMIMPTSNEQVTGCGIGRSLRTNDRYYQEAIEYVNSYAQDFFGKGEEKTIKNWKNFNYTNLIDTTNESATAIKGLNEETLYQADSIVNVSIDMDTTILKIEVPRPNPITETITTEDFVDRWSK